MQLIDFPYALIAEITVFRIANPPGLFAYRQASAVNLLHMPNLVGGDLTREQAEEALEQFVPLKRPLAALALFWSVVAIEDLIRQMSLGLAHVPGLMDFFNGIPKLAAPRSSAASRYKRSDGDPVALLDPTKVNARYAEVLHVQPIDLADEPRLGDLIILRHTIAHHGGLVRDVDLSRVRYYRLTANALINPPASFVRDIVGFVYSVGSRLVAAVRKRVFATVAPPLLQNWAGTPQTVPALINDLIELFDYFGKLAQGEEIPPDDDALDQSQPKLDGRGHDIQEELLIMCVDELRRDYCSRGRQPPNPRPNHYRH